MPDYIPVDKSAFINRVKCPRVRSGNNNDTAVSLTYLGRDKTPTTSNVNENVRISIRFSLKFVLNGPINNIPTLIQIMARRRPGNKPFIWAIDGQITDAYMRHSASVM